MVEFNFTFVLTANHTWEENTEKNEAFQKFFNIFFPVIFLGGKTWNADGFCKTCHVKKLQWDNNILWCEKNGIVTLENFL